MSPASAPRGPVVVPDAVRSRLRAPEPVWLNEEGGLTFRDAAAGVFAKWNPPGTAISLAAERDRLAWARPHHPVPEVVEYAADETGELLVTRALPGDSAVAERWLADPHTAVRAIGEGLRALHEQLPVDDCPFSWSADDRLARRTPETRAELGEAPPVEQLVVCHGDACAPNTLLGPDGRWIAHVDLGTLGLADRWADLAVASMSLGWNYGDGFEAEFFAAYGVRPDVDRIRYYRALWNSGDQLTIRRMAGMPDAPTIFERIIAREIPADIVFEDERVIAFRDIAPQAPVHLLVVPKTAEYADVAALAAADPGLLAYVVEVAKHLAAEHADGDYRLVFNSGENAGQTVFHVHAHVLAGGLTEGSLV